MEAQAKFRKVLISLIFVFLIAVLIYLLNWLYIYRQMLNGFSTKDIFDLIFTFLKRDIVKVVGISVAAIMIALSSISFQTLTNNRILTPNLMGFDAVYVLLKTVLIFFFENSAFIQNKILMFIVSTVIMIFYTLGMYALVLRKNKNNIVFLLLVGLVLTTLTRSVSSFLQMIMDPSTIDSLLSSVQTTIVSMNLSIVWYVVPIMLILAYLFMIRSREYDVMSLGQDHAINLGIEYVKKSHETLILIAIAMSISTALIGPMAFLGLLVVNAARELVKTHRHLPLMIISSLIAMIFLVFGQAVANMFFNEFSVTVVISLLGGIYMIYLIIKENRG